MMEEYREQAKPEGIAQAFLIADSFIGQDAVTLILGDNVFYGGDGFQQAFGEFKSGATIFESPADHNPLPCGPTELANT